MVKGLTKRQAEVLALIREAMRETGMPPTRTEIAEALGFRSANAAEEHLRALARKGAIELMPGTSRGIRLPGELPPAIGELPVVGRVAAGAPLLAAEHIEDHHRVDPHLFRPAADYLLRVVGMSMRDAGILDGDLLAVHAQGEVRNRQIAVFRIDDEVTVKRFKRSGHQVSLLPENSEFDPIEIDLRHQELVIEGLGVGVLRTSQ
ncbi:MAG: transcriptional repressor LexA [Pseudomonadota bacterium]